MARVKVLATRDRLPEIQERAWEVACRLEVLGASELQVELSISRKVAVDTLDLWEREGRVRLKHGGGRGPENGRPRRKLFEIAPEYREEKERGFQVARQLWRAARRLRDFTPTDLKAHCSAELKVETEEASDYCQILLRADYLAVIRKAAPGIHEARYRLLINNGPAPPQEKRVRAVWDPNLGEYVHISGLGRIGGAG